MAVLAPEALIHIGQVPVTNTMLHIVIVDILILSGIFYLHKNLSRVPTVFQNGVEYVTDAFYNLTQSIAGKNTQTIFPWFMGFFIFIVVTNMSALLPGFETIKFHAGEESVPLLRSAASDINMTLGLALISVIATHIIAVQKVGIWDYLGRYFSLNPIFLFVGILEIVSEFTKVISLSFRLFGNILAGETVLTTVLHMFAFFLPLPFLGLEIIVALVQALVFSILTMVFMAMLATSHKEHAHEHS